MIEIDFAAFALDAVGDGAKRSTKAQADQHPADEEKSDVHVSAFPDVICAATQDRAATGAGRGRWGGADDGSDGAGLEQHLHAGEVGEDCLAHSLFSQTVMMGVADGALGGSVTRATDGDASAFQGEGDVAALRLDCDHALVGGAGHAARPLRVVTGVMPKISLGVTAPFVAAQILRITAAEGMAPRRTRLTVDWSMPTRAAKAGSVIALADR